MSESATRVFFPYLSGKRAGVCEVIVNVTAVNGDGSDTKVRGDGILREHGAWASLAATIRDFVPPTLYSSLVKDFWKDNNVYVSLSCPIGAVLQGESFEAACFLKVMLAVFEGRTELATTATAYVSGGIAGGNICRVEGLERKRRAILDHHARGGGAAAGLVSTIFVVPESNTTLDTLSPIEGIETRPLRTTNELWETALGLVHDSSRYRRESRPSSPSGPAAVAPTSSANERLLGAAARRTSIIGAALLAAVVIFWLVRTSSGRGRAALPAAGDEVAARHAPLTHAASTRVLLTDAPLATPGAEVPTAPANQRRALARRAPRACKTLDDLETRIDARSGPDVLACVESLRQVARLRGCLRSVSDLYDLEVLRRSLPDLRGCAAATPNAANESATPPDTR